MTLSPLQALALGWPGAGQLFVDTNDQPFDRSREQIEHDIEPMKVARFANLSWDSFEPAQGRFDFRLADWIMDRTVQCRACYVNTTGEAKDVAITGTMKGVISVQTWIGTLKLPPLGAELLQAP